MKCLKRTERFIDGGHLVELYSLLLLYLEMPPEGPDVPGNPMSGSFPTGCNGGQSRISTPETTASCKERLFPGENIRT